MATGDNEILEFLEFHNGEAAVGAMCNLREEPWRKCEVRCKPGARVCVAVAMAMAVAMADDDICKLVLGWGGRVLGRVLGESLVPMSQRLSPCRMERWCGGSLRRLPRKCLHVLWFVSFDLWSSPLAASSGGLI